MTRSPGDWPIPPGPAARPDRGFLSKRDKATRQDDGLAKMLSVGRFKALPSASFEFVVSTRALANETWACSPGIKRIANSAVGTPGA